MADVRGRRNVLIASLLLSCLPATFLLLTQLFSHLDPFWYYCMYSLGGITSYSSVVFASLSDSVPEQYRAPSYGMLLAILYIGFAASPTVALLLGHRNTTIAYLAFMVLATLVAYFWLPETLPDDIRRANVQKQAQEHQDRMSSSSSWAQQCWYIVSRPVRDISILTHRTNNIRLLAAASFLSSMVFSSDSTLLLYYIENRLNVNDSDIAKIYFAIGVVGFLLQAGGLQPAVKCLGEHKLLIATFVIGFLHNVAYGLAQTKHVVFAAMIVAQLTQLNFPVVSSFISKGVSAHEQGRVQGALSASNSIARGIGPLSMEFVYHHTKNKKHLGPGFMFIYAGILDLFGILLIVMLPSRSYARVHETSPLENGGEPVEYETFSNDPIQQQEQDDDDDTETDDRMDDVDEGGDVADEPFIELPQEEAHRMA
jgi:MFS transporter, DHA1 family, tetracycline resistance protein